MSPIEPQLEKLSAGTMVWTIVYREFNGNLATKVVTGSHDTEVFRESAKKKYKRLVAFMKGNHQVLTEKL